MPELKPVRSNKKRRFLGYVTRIFREFINGDDSSITVAKAAIVIIFGVPAALAAGPILVAGAAVFGLLYVASAVIDEYHRNKAEDEKLLELQAYNEETQALAKTVQNTLSPEPLDNEVEESFAYQGNDQLLKKLLLDYLSRLNLLKDDMSTDAFDRAVDRKRKANGRLPGQNGMIRLIESVTGFDSTEPEFASKVAKYLNQTAIPDKTDQNFGNRVVKVLGLSNSELNEDVTLTQEKKTKSLFYRAKQVLKYFMITVAKSNTGMGLAVGAGVLLGFLVLGTAPLSLPVILACAGIGLLTGASFLVYDRFVRKPNKVADATTDKELKEKKTQYELLHKIERINQKNYKELNVFSQPDGKVTSPVLDALDDQPVLEDSCSNEKEALLSEEKEKVSEAKPASTLTKELPKARHRADVAAQTFYGMSIGMVIGIAIVGLIFAAGALATAPFSIPFLAVTVPALAVGVVYGARYGFTLGKDTKKTNAAEVKRIQEVEKLQHKYEEQLGKEYVDNLFHKSKRDLLEQLLVDYISYVENQPIAVSGETKTALEATMQSKQERVFRLIEDLKLKNPDGSTIKRAINPEGLRNKAGDDKFYQDLGFYLRGDKGSAEKVSNLVTSFKQIVQGPDCEKVVIPAPRNALMRFLKSIGSSIKSGATNRTLLRHVFPTVAAVGIALVLGIMFFTPVGAIGIAVVGTAVMAAFAVHKVLEYKANKNLEKLAETEAKLPLIDAISKLENKTILVPAPSKKQIVGEVLEEKSNLLELPEEDKKEKVAVAIEPTAAEPEIEKSLFHRKRAKTLSKTTLEQFKGTTEHFTDKHPIVEQKKEESVVKTPETKPPLSFLKGTVYPQANNDVILPIESVANNL